MNRASRTGPSAVMNEGTMLLVIQIGERHLQVQHWVLRAAKARAAAAKGWLRMALRAAIAIKRSQSDARLARYAATHRIYSHKARNRPVEEGLLVRAQARDGSPLLRDRRGIQDRAEPQGFPRSPL